MSKSNSEAEVFSAPNLLQAKIGGPIGTGDLYLIQKAEEALKDMKGDFAIWLEEEVEKLEATAKEAKAAGLASDEGEKLFICAHDLRGLGATYEFPIITRLAKSLTKIIDIPAKREKASFPLVMAHVGAIRAALSQNIRDVDDSVAAALAEELEKQALAFAAPWKDE
jgi:chemotaxis protein histidine kinase CheA